MNERIEKAISSVKPADKEVMTAAKERQAQLAKQDHNYHMPVFFITEMIGIALGMKQKDLGVDRHFIATEEVMCKLEEYEQEQLQKMMNEGGEA